MERQVDGAKAVIRPHVRGASLLMQARNVTEKTSIRSAFRPLCSEPSAETIFGLFDGAAVTLSAMWVTTHPYSVSDRTSARG
jgi:hypothetical protein